MSFVVVEYHGRGDPFFGGSADDRQLGTDGRFMRPPFGVSEVAAFATREVALAAGEAAPNRRADGLVAVHEAL